MSVPVSQFIPPPSSRLGNHKFVLYICDYFCFAHNFISTIFLDSTYKQYYMISVFLFPTCFTLYDSL